MMRSYEPDNSKSQLDPTRLLEAADAILVAETRCPNGNGLVTLWNDSSSPAREGFTYTELVEGLMFLRRLGLMKPDHPKAARR